MEWTRSETLALAVPNCSHCFGTGIRSLKRGQPHACNCVLRAIFRACYARFRHCATKEKYLSKVSLDCTARGGRRIWGRKDRSISPISTLVSRRSLTPEEYRLFSFHFLLGADWRLCCRRLGMDRGTFFHSVYRIEQKLGKIFRESQTLRPIPFGSVLSRPSGKRLDGRPGAATEGAGDAPALPPDLGLAAGRLTIPPAAASPRLRSPSRDGRFPTRPGRGTRVTVSI